MKYYFILNPAAGAVDSPKTLIPLIDEYFKKAGIDRTIYVTDHPGHATELARQIAESGEEARICACGGDGTLNEVVRGVAGHSNVAITIYPGGSGNDFIKNFGTREEFADVGLVVNGISRPVDLIKINDDLWCANIFSVGVDADVAAGIPKWRRMPFCGGPMAYNLSLVETVIKPMGKRFSINGEPKDVLIITACNGRVYGGAYNAAPEAELDDGLMDLVVVDKIGKLRVAQLIPVYKAGKHVENGVVTESLSDVLTYSRVNKLHITSDTPFSTNIDGEVVRMRSAKLQVVPGALNFIVPNRE